MGLLYFYSLEIIVLVLIFSVVDCTSLQEELLAKKTAERSVRLANVQHDVQEKLKELDQTYQEKEKAMKGRFQQLESHAGCV